MSQKSQIFAIICIFTDEIFRTNAMKTLTNTIILLIACLPLVSCGSLSQASRAQRQAEERTMKAQMTEAIEKGDFVLDIKQIIPRGFPSRTSTGEYALRLKDNVVTTRLPYFGEARTATLGGEEISIVFEKEKVSLQRDWSDASKGEYRYMFKGGKGIEKWTVILQLYDNGKAHIVCTSSGGRYMSFIADILIPEPESETK